jgi:hypothetical protein
MKQMAPGAWRPKELPLPAINIYLAEDVLVDAGRTWDRRRVFAEIEDDRVLNEGDEVAGFRVVHAPATLAAR